MSPGAASDPAFDPAFGTVLAREFEDPAYFAVHQLTVAAYRLDHADGGSDHTVAALLSVLRGCLDDGLEGARLRAHVRRTSEQLRAHPPGPVRRVGRPPGTGIADVARARDADEHCAVVRRWAAEVWEAWRPVADELGV
ncbi:hypothetical protein I4I73_13195 [Pseudonocardia sp. KRD-184]|uniref:Uncharacterized protein n=1 Tax=Pseudonocardia oceani TaxID=2792013 RepID=A0ABS6U790_9PSEU|nr:DUF5946 family protein [Pseudonocardia oceani]MBW0089853.1 hypothetical protein [Pseudonocardia oceani]MBW0096943.1 hypothetical protein [Pseudonocardia oceani]MBW0108932.1 hypothetical protein [Pseudonocardia oceani]MBW0120864.1 hypothetical protein [Pseudonocardia oceani]MBW0128075.1 hypothetical protein [Pseudonocardia oceani]